MMRKLLLVIGSLAVFGIAALGAWHFLSNAEHAPDAPSSVRVAKLTAAAELIGRSDPETAEGRALALEALTEADAGARVAAVKVLLHEPLVREREVLARLAGLLCDPEPEVRRLAVIAVGEDRDGVRDEQLLPLLHDTDTEVRRLCEVALRSRGLSDEHLRLARLVSHSDPSIRIQVLAHLRQSTDLDRETWLRLLSNDPAPAIRAAAARAAGNVIPLRPRLAEMAASDPSETVRDIARYWLDRSAIRRTSE